MKNHATVEYRNMRHKNLAGALSELRETCVADYTCGLKIWRMRNEKD